jgi:regulator of nucleoside diphosphate kinase
LIDLDTDEEEIFILVFPKDAEHTLGKISVLAPIGTAMLGHRVDDIFDWDVPSGKRKLKVKEILYQPEASRDFHL